MVVNFRIGFADNKYDKDMEGLTSLTKPFVTNQVKYNIFLKQEKLKLVLIFKLVDQS